MAKAMLHTTLSLDGFMARPDGRIDDWAFGYGSDNMAAGVKGEIGAVVMGNRNFDADIQAGGLPYGGQVKVPQFVVTHTARPPLTAGGLAFTFVTGGVDAAVVQARAAAGDKLVALLGASIDQQCLRAGLVDEIMLHVVPILLGEGIRLFDHLGAQTIKLERVEIVSTAQITSKRFRVVK